MAMEKYTTEFDRKEFACARVEDANVSYKDLTQVCGRIRGKNADWAMEFLEKVIKGKAAVLYKQHCKRVGHRRELGGKKGRYPKKASAAVLKVLQSAIANGKVKGMGETYEILNAAANRRFNYGRVAAKGRWARSDYETSRIEIILRPLETVPKGVEVKPPPKKAEEKKPEMKPEVKKEEPKKETPKKQPEIKKEEKKPEMKKEEPKPEAKKEMPKEVKKPEPKKEEKPPEKKEEKPKEEPKKEVKKPEPEKKEEAPKKEEKKEPEEKKEESDVKTEVKK